MILGYTIVTSEGGLFEYLAWTTSGLKQVWEKLGECYLNSNEFARAKAAWGRALDLASSEYTVEARHKDVTTATAAAWPRNPRCRPTW